MEFSVTEQSDQNGERKLALAGRLEFDTAPEVLVQVKDKLAENSSVNIDLSGVTAANSAGLALMVEWKSLAAQSETIIRYTGVPASLLSIADVCQVQSLLLD